jgi:hypothetical protein
VQKERRLKPRNNVPYTRVIVPVVVVCPKCFETRMIDQIGASFYCNVCSTTFTLPKG